MTANYLLLIKKKYIFSFDVVQLTVIATITMITLVVAPKRISVILATLEAAAHRAVPDL